MNIIKNIKGKILLPFKDVVRSMEFTQRKVVIDQNMLFSTESGITTERYCDHDIIVSLTTYGRRIHSVYMAIESVMEQTMKPNRIILWLDHSFEGKRLPESLNKLRKRGLEIAYCKDILSYKKLIPTLAKYPNDAIITVDDDEIYDPNMLENLIAPYLENQRAVYCNRMHKMTFDSNGKLAPYNKWQGSCTEKGFSNLYFPTGIGGILYPPHSLDEEVSNEKVFMDICKHADDVWFKAMSLKKGTPVCHVETFHPEGDDYVEIREVQDTALWLLNCNQSANDKQIEDVFTKYGLYKLLDNHAE